MTAAAQCAFATTAVFAPDASAPVVVLGIARILASQLLMFRVPLLLKILPILALLGDQLVPLLFVLWSAFASPELTGAGRSILRKVVWMDYRTGLGHCAVSCGSRRCRCLLRMHRAVFFTEISRLPQRPRWHTLRTDQSAKRNSTAKARGSSVRTAIFSRSDK
jgi:hypothetical protein